MPTLAKSASLFSLRKLKKHECNIINSPSSPTTLTSHPVLECCGKNSTSPSKWKRQKRSDFGSPSHINKLQDRSQSTRVESPTSMKVLHNLTPQNISKSFSLQASSRLTVTTDPQAVKTLRHCKTARARVRSRRTLSFNVESTHFLNEDFESAVKDQLYYIFKQHLRQS